MNNKKGDLKKGKITDINKLNTKELLTEEIYNSDIVPKLTRINEQNYSSIKDEITKYLEDKNGDSIMLTKYIKRDMRVYSSMDNEWIKILLEELLKESKGNGGDGNVK